MVSVELEKLPAKEQERTFWGAGNAPGLEDGGGAGPGYVGQH